MPSIDFKVVDSLINEVVDLVKSSKFLSGETSEKSQVFDVGSCVVSWKVVDHSEYITCINSENEETAFNLFESQILAPSEGCSIKITGYCDCSEEISNTIFPIFEELEKIIINTPQIRSLANQVHKDHSCTQDLETIIDHLFQCISNHFKAIIECRILTLSKRFVPLEVLFQAYSVGLFPFGWNPKTNTILCLRPSFEYK